MTATRRHSQGILPMRTYSTSWLRLFLLLLIGVTTTTSVGARRSRGPLPPHFVRRSRRALTTPNHHEWNAQARVLQDATTDTTDSTVAPTTWFDATSPPSPSPPPSEPPNADSSTPDSYEFIAFLLWYIFLVMCCVIPACCAFRRRRWIEARMAEQESSILRQWQQHQLGGPNGFLILSALQQQQIQAAMLARNQQGRLNDELVQTERARMLETELKATTMTITTQDLAQRDEAELEGDGTTAPWHRGRIVAMHGFEQQNQNVNNSCHRPLTQEAIPETNALDAELEKSREETSLGPAFDIEDTGFSSVVRLPSSLPVRMESKDGDNNSNDASDIVYRPCVNGDRWIPGVCTICLAPYEAGEQLSWSNRPTCSHAFHTECIIPWLAKKESPQCPICRQDFCHAQEVVITPAMLLQTPILPNGNVDPMSSTTMTSTSETYQRDPRNPQDTANDMARQMQSVSLTFGSGNSLPVHHSSSNGHFLFTPGGYSHSIALMEQGRPPSSSSLTLPVTTTASSRLSAQHHLQPHALSATTGSPAPATGSALPSTSGTSTALGSTGTTGTSTTTTTTTTTQPTTSAVNPLGSNSFVVISLSDSNRHSSGNPDNSHNNN